MVVEVVVEGEVVLEVDGGRGDRGEGSYKGKAVMEGEVVLEGGVVVE